MLIAGEFTQFDPLASTRNRIARINTSGSLDTNFSTGSGANAIATALALQPNGKILIGGAFTVLRGGNRKRIARLNSDSSVDVSFNASRSPDNTISTVLRKNINQRADREAFFKEIGTLIGEFDLEHHIGVCLLHNHNLVTNGHFMLERFDKMSY